MIIKLSSGKDLVIRKARKSEFRIIVGMLGEIPEYGWDLKRGLKTLEFTSKMSKEKIFVGLIDKEIVCLLALRESFYLERKINLDELAVSIKHQGKGIGSALINFTKECAKKKGISWIEISATNRKDPACEFYKKHGFIDQVNAAVMSIGCPWIESDAN